MVSGPGVGEGLVDSGEAITAVAETGRHHCKINQNKYMLSPLLIAGRVNFYGGIGKRPQLEELSSFLMNVGSGQHLRPAEIGWLQSAYYAHLRAGFDHLCSAKLYDWAPVSLIPGSI